MSSGRRRIERVPSGSAVSSAVSKFSQKSQESFSKDKPPSKLREPLASRETSANKAKGPKSPVSPDQSVSKLKQTGSQSSIKSAENKEQTVSAVSNSRRSSDASTETDISITTSTNGDLSPLGKITTPKFVNPEQSGYVGFANLPNQVHRKSVKKGFEFTLMVVGESGLGKSTLVNSLFLTDLYPERHIPSAQEKVQQTVKIDASSVEIEERGVKLRLTVVDTPGFGDSLNSVECFKPIIQYIDDQFERYLNDESGLNRRHIVDNRVHCCFYFINPSGHGMRPLDIAFMKAVHHKVNIVPVIAKADTLTKKEVLNLKRKIMNQIEQYNISLYPLPDVDEDEDEDYREQCRLLKEAVPFAVVGSNTIIEVKGKKVRGRMYPWGVVEVENPDHCDFIKLRTMLITHMQDLQEVTQEVHYENFRAEKLANGTLNPKKPSAARGQPKEEPPVNAEASDQRELALQEKEKELRRMQQMVAQMQAEMAAQKGGEPQQNGGVRSHNV